MTFKVPFPVRLQRAKRYASDSDYRLRKINYNRARIGLPLLRSADEIRSYSEVSRAAAARKPRDQRGRFA